jgi:formate hydrogenlyase subunit 5
VSGPRAGDGAVRDLPGTGPWRSLVVAAVRDGERLAGLFVTRRDPDALLTAVLVGPYGIRTAETAVGGDGPYPALTPDVPAAACYERDLNGLRPDGLTRTPSLTGPGLFTITHGPVRSGVLESLEFLVETPGEDIPALSIRPSYKHRGVARGFEGLAPRDGVLAAERVEGIASVGHALAYCQAVESLAGITISEEAGLARVAHAELERVANHLDVATRLADAAGLAAARLGWHKEEVMRLVSGLCGSRFGRGVIVIGGVASAGRDRAAAGWSDLAAQVARLGSRIVRRE